MERIPSTAVVHKMVEVIDSKYTTLIRPYISNPVEQTFGPHQFGVYKQADPQRPFAFERIKNIWGIDDSLEDDTCSNTTTIPENKEEIQTNNDGKNNNEATGLDHQIENREKIDITHRITT